jgi:hypothetical protein
MTLSQALSTVVELAIQTHRDNIALAISAPVSLEQSENLRLDGQAIGVIDRLCRELPVYTVPLRSNP